MDHQAHHKALQDQPIKNCCKDAGNRKHVKSRIVPCGVHHEHNCVVCGAKHHVLEAANEVIVNPNP